MAETSRFWTTNGTGDGPGGGYTQQQFYDFLRRVFLKDNEDVEGVLKNVLNGLVVSSPSATNIDVATGAAMVYGFFYENSSILNLSFSAPAATTGGRVVLTVDWTAQTVRAEVILSASGVTSSPALTQTAGTEWQLSIATFQTDNAGNVSSLVNTSDFASFGTDVTLEMMADNSVDTDQIVADAINGSKIEDNAINSEHYVDGSIDTIHISNEAVTAQKIDNRTRRFFVTPSKVWNVTTGAEVSVSLNTSGRSNFRMADAVDSMAFGNFVVPEDFVSGLTVVAVIESQGAGNIYTADVDASYGSPGQAGNIHTAAVSDGALAVSANIIAEVRSLSLSSAVAGDFITNLVFARDATNGADTVSSDVRFWGWIVEYTADS